ncbi:MAG: hypothetical protein M1819_004788 [Sarea resinae]|nr:MAG: hypothetical protein M1819_004788 [Sarea resinae]
MGELKSARSWLRRPGKLPQSHGQPSEPPSQNAILRTTILVRNVHCASCIAYVGEVLNTFRSSIHHLDVNIVTHEVQIEHTSEVSAYNICRTLTDAAFEVYGASTTDAAGNRIAELDVAREESRGWLEQATDYLGHSPRLTPRGSVASESRSHPGRSQQEKRQKHIENCKACQSEEKMALDERESSSTSDDRHVSQAPTLQKHASDEKRLLGDELRQYNYSSARRDTGIPDNLVPPQESPDEKMHQGDGTSAPVIVIDSPENQAAQPRYEAVISIGGMTCSSCTGSVTDGLREFAWVKDINVNLLTNSATIIFEGAKERTDEIIGRVEDLGYDCTLQSCEALRLQDHDRKRTPSTDVPFAEVNRVTLSIGGMTCSSCTSAVTRAVQELPRIKSINVSLLTNSASITFEGPKEFVNEIVMKVDDLGYECSVDGEVKRDGQMEEGGKSKNQGDVFMATLSIKGMTCASCAGAIAQTIKELSYVRSVNIALLTNSGIVEFERRENVDAIAEKVEDLGYECKVEEIKSLDLGDLSEDPQRTTMIAVDGMFCQHCPPRLSEALRSTYGGNVTIAKPPTLKDPIMKITYTPHPPDFTVRNIISTLSSVSDPFSATVYHPPSIEERSRAVQLHEQHRLLIRLVLSIVFAIPTFLVGVVWMDLVSSSNSVRKFFDKPIWSGSVTRSQWALFILATPVMFFAADVFHIRAIKEIRALWRPGSKVPILRRFYRFGSMNLLMSAGTSVAYFSSLAILIVGATTSGNKRVSTSTYFDSVVFLTMFILMGRFLEAYSKAKTGDAVGLLGKLRPSEALLVSSNSRTGSSESQDTAKNPSSTTIQTIPVDLLEVSDRVLVPHGTSPPADGIVVIGQTQFNESSLTGESRPVPKPIGEKVFAGSINIGNPVTVKVTEIGGTSMLDQIVAVVREGQTKRAPVERVADVLTGYFVPVITLLAILTFVIWLALGQSGTLPRDYLDVDTGGWAFWALEFAIAVFVVACPCGIGLAAPTALFVGSGLAAKYGILVKGGGEAFQEASKLDAVVFDKTGTLTEGLGVKVTDEEILVEAEDAKVVWAIARSLEESSGHPIAQAVVDYCETKEKVIIDSADIEEIPGCGLRGSFQLNNVQYEGYIGNEPFINRLSGIETETNYWATSRLSAWKSQGKSVVLVAIRKQDSSAIRDDTPFTLSAILATADPLRPSATPVIRRLQQMGIAVYLLSGDNVTTATAVGSSVGIKPENVIAGVLPHEKAEVIRQLQRGSLNLSRAPSVPGSEMHTQTKTVAMVGDGINDAPALAAATISIAIGSGSDIALSSASFILLTSNLSSLLTLLSLSRTVFRRVKFNFAWALLYNTLMIPLAAGVIYPARGHPKVGPVWASLAMAASSVSVVASSLALRIKWRGIGFREEKVGTEEGA